MLGLYNFVEGVRSKEESVPILLFLLLLLISLALNLQSPSNKVLFGLFLLNIILHFGWYGPVWLFRVYEFILLFVTGDPKIQLFQVNLNFELLLLINKTTYTKSALTRCNDDIQQD